jgi:hypothetical protein
VIKADGSALPVRQYLIETYDYDFRWADAPARAGTRRNKGKSKK